jgi:hypothetical protein
VSNLSFEVRERLRLFDEATARQRERQHEARLEQKGDRDWTREELYERERRRSEVKPPRS